MRKHAAREAAPDLKDAPDIQPAFQLSRGVRSTIRAAISARWICECLRCLVAGVPCDTRADHVLGDLRRLVLVCRRCAVHQDDEVTPWFAAMSDVANGLEDVPDNALERALDLL